MMTEVATVFGGTGFLGRYVVKRLAGAGYGVRVVTRRPDRALFLKPMGAVGQVEAFPASITDATSTARAVAGAALVVNLVGILAERRAGDFQRVHADAAGNLAAAAREAGVRALVHVSAIGADAASPSRYGASKAAGEAAVRAAFATATILRPSIIFGPEDNFFNRFGAMAAFSPVLPVIAGATRFQPVYVADVADAVIAGLARPGATFELGGPDIRTFRELLAWILVETKRRRCLLDVPMAVARMQATVLERLPGRLLTRDQLLMLAQDNVVAPGVPGLRELGIVPTPMAMVVPAYLRRFRPGGGSRGL